MTISNKFWISLSALSITAAAVLLFVNLKYKSTSKTAYVLPGKVFKDYEGTRELEKKFVKLQQQQKYILDSMLTEVKVLETSSAPQIKILLQKKEVYNKVLSQFENSNKEQYGQYTESIWKQINQYVSEYGRANDYQYIYGADGSGNLMYADSTQDITNKVLVFINKKYAGN